MRRWKLQNDKYITNATHHERSKHNMSVQIWLVGKVVRIYSQTTRDVKETIGTNGSELKGSA